MMTFSREMFNYAAEIVLAIWLVVWAVKKVYRWAKLRRHPKFKENVQIKEEFRSRHQRIKEAIKNAKKSKKMGG